MSLKCFSAYPYCAITYYNTDQLPLPDTHAAAVPDPWVQPPLGLLGLGRITKLLSVLTHSLTKNAAAANIVIDVLWDWKSASSCHISSHPSMQPKANYYMLYPSSQQGCIMELKGSEE